MVLNFYGTQLVAQLTKKPLTPQKSIYPRHCGIIFLDHSQWENFLAQCRQKELTFFQQPRQRHQGEITQHETFFLSDPSGNLIEFKYYFHTQAIFGTCQGASIGDS